MEYQSGGDSMNRKRCPWCGKITDKSKDKYFSWNDFPFSHRIMKLYTGKCSHCKNKYGQYPTSHNLIVVVIAVLLFTLAIAFQSVFFLTVAVFALIWSIVTYIFIPYSKLNDKGSPCEENIDLLCRFEIIEQYGKIKKYELYYLNDCFDDFQPFVLPSPINVYYAPRKNRVILGEFLYIHEKNYDYMNKDSCELFDTDMNLVARIKFNTMDGSMSRNEN